MQKFLESYNEQTGTLIKIVLKTFHHMMHLQLPDHLLDPNNLQKWMTYFKILIDNPVPIELSTPTIDEQEMIRREKTYFWVHKKWTGRILQRMIQKFSNPKFVDKSISNYATYIQ
jgi:hypothetical protein